MKSILHGRFNTYIVERNVHVQSDVEDQDVVTYIYSGPAGVLELGQPETSLIDVIRTPLIEMALEEQHQRVVEEFLDGESHWQ